MRFSIKDFFIKYDQIPTFLRIWSNLLKKSLMENFIFLCNVHSEVVIELAEIEVLRIKFELLRIHV